MQQSAILSNHCISSYIDNLARSDVTPGVQLKIVPLGKPNSAFMEGVSIQMCTLIALQLAHVSPGKYIAK